MVTQRPLEALFMVRIHVGQPNFSNESGGSEISCTKFVRHPAQPPDGRVRFPVTTDDTYMTRARDSRQREAPSGYGNMPSFKRHSYEFSFLHLLMMVVSLTGAPIVQ